MSIRVMAMVLVVVGFGKVVGNLRAFWGGGRGDARRGGDISYIVELEGYSRVG